MKLLQSHKNKKQSKGNNYEAIKIVTMVFKTEGYKSLIEWNKRKHVQILGHFANVAIYIEESLLLYLGRAMWM